MTTLPAVQVLSPSRRSGVATRPILIAATLVALATSLVARAFIGLGDSLWLDETWTGVFATEPTLPALTRQVLNDVNAPAHAFFIWGWARIFGVSDLALRAPSVIFALATPAVAWFGLQRSRPLLALVWCALLAVWTPGIELSGYARCYPLLMLAATASAVAFLRVLERPTLGRTAVWVGAASFVVLTHYHAVFLAAAQAVLFAVVHRRRLAAVAPAALVATPALAWMAVHMPLLAAYAAPGTAWYNRLTLAGLPSSAAFLLGSPAAVNVVALAVLGGLILARRAGPPARAAPDGEAPGATGMVGAASLLGAAACLAAAMLSPSFTARYLTPFVPGVLLLVACAVVYGARGRWEAPVVLIAAFCGLAYVWMSQAGGDRVYNFEKASAWLAEAKPARLVFLFDHPATRVAHASQLDRVGGFFLRRAGNPVAVIPLVSRPESDMTAAMLAAAGPDRHTALLWLYDTSVHDTAAAVRPPRITERDPRFTCRDFGLAEISVLACRQRTP